MARQDQHLARAVKSLISESSIVHGMDYTLIRISDREQIETLEGLVLARAYEAAWRALHECEPVGQHRIESLGVVIDFGARASQRH